MRKAPLILLCLLIAFVAPQAASAQDEGPPPTLILSHFQCDWNRLGDVISELELNVPIWEELVGEGVIQDAGSYVHQWADEWNVGIYIVAESMDAAVAGNDESNSRFAERHPDANAFAEACPQHRDNFYQFGPVADSEGAATGGNPALVISMYQCDYDRIGDVFDQYAEFGLPVQQAQIAEGQLRGAGTFAHTWADEWNVGFYWVADDVNTFIDAWNDSNQRVGQAVQAAGSPANALGEACPVHKDAIYTLGPRTGVGDDEGEAGGDN